MIDWIIVIIMVLLIAILLAQEGKGHENTVERERAKRRAIADAYIATHGRRDG